MSHAPTTTPPSPPSAATAATVHSIRYQRRPGLQLGRWTWPAIVVHGVKTTLRDPRNLFLLLPAFGFVLATAATFYVLSLVEALAGTEEARGAFTFVRNFLRVDVGDVARVREFRLQLWEGTFILMIKAQMLYLVVVLARLGSGLIADDLRTRALPIYFAHPVTPATYLLGKWTTAATFVAAIMLIPNLLSVGAGILVAGLPGTWAQTLKLVADLCVSGLAVMVLSGLVILAIGAVLKEKGMVIVAWLATTLMPHALQALLLQELPEDRTTGLLGSLSPASNVVALTTWLFDLRAAWEASGLPTQAYEAALGHRVESIYPALVLLAIAGLAALVLYRRVAGFSKAAASA